MMVPMQARNTGVAGKDFGNKEYKFTFCYLVKFYDEDGRLLCAEPYTTTAESADEALDTVDREVSRDLDLYDYYDADIQLEDVC